MLADIARMSIPLAPFEAELVGWAGDWHGNTQFALNAISKFADAGVRVVYQVGDFGLWGGHDGAAYLRKLHKRLEQHDMLLVITPGNHENYDMLEKFPLNEHGFQFRADVDRLWFAPRGHIWTHHGAYLAALGGAGSIDRYWRTEGTSWWPQERITEEDIHRTIANFDALNIPAIDVMMTHEAPAGVFLGPKGILASPELEHYCYEQRVLLRNAVDHVTPRTLVHGHWHRSIDEVISGVSDKDIDYRTEVIGLDMDGTNANLMVGELAPASGILSARPF